VGLVVLFTQVPLWTPAPFTTSNLDVVFMPCIDPRRASDNTAKPRGAMQRGEASLRLPRMNDLAAGGSASDPSGVLATEQELSKSI